MWKPFLSLVFIIFLILFASCGKEINTVRAAERPQEQKTQSGVFVRDQTVQFIFVPDRSNITNVAITGDFNKWSPSGWNFGYSTNAWVLTIQLPYGIYQYKLILNGSDFIANPYSEAFAPDGKGGKNSILEVFQNSERTN
jgi:hypothetical protein